jgi:hypothetical protein
MGFAIVGVPVSVKVSIDYIDVIIEGDVLADFGDRVAEEIRANAETVIQHRCILEEI